MTGHKLPEVLIVLMQENSAGITSAIEMTYFFTIRSAETLQLLSGTQIVNTDSQTKDNTFNFLIWPN